MCTPPPPPVCSHFLFPGGWGASLPRPRTVQSQETEIPSLEEERKLQTKCFFLKSRKEAAPWNFLMGKGLMGRNFPAHRLPGPVGVGTEFSVLTG